MISFEQIINKVNKYKMDIKQIYREETDLDVYAEHSLNYANYTNEYVKWLEAKINYTRCSTQLLCVNSYKTWDTTQGKLYKIKSESEKEYRIINDSGKEDSYFKKHFKKVEDK